MGPRPAVASSGRPGVLVTGLAPGAARRGDAGRGERDLPRGTPSRLARRRLSASPAASAFRG
eukprot:11159051-Lingulodinium_polyedra.AAC.1